MSIIAVSITRINILKIVTPLKKMSTKKEN